MGKENWNLTLPKRFWRCLDCGLYVLDPLQTCKQMTIHFLQDNKNLPYHEFTSIGICILQHNGKIQMRETGQVSILRKQ